MVNIENQIILIIYWVHSSLFAFFDHNCVTLYYRKNTTHFGILLIT